LTNPLQHSTGTSAEGEDVPGTAQVGGDCGGIDRDVNRRRSIARGNSGRDPEPPLCVNADRERRRLILGVPLRHLRQAKLVATLASEGQADQAPPVQGHEVDGLRRDQLRGANEVALVLAILVVRDDDELAVLQVVDRLFDGAEGHESELRLRSSIKARTYFPIVSPSRCTGSPATRSPRVVCCKVNGISETWMTEADGIALTVRLTPSTVIEPSGIDTAAISAGATMSSKRASSRSATCSTLPTPSTWPCTRCPPSRSPTCNARSRFTLKPTGQRPKRVRSSDVSIT